MTLRRWVPNGSHVNWKRVSLATGYKRPGDFMRFQVINTRDLANFIQLPLGRFFLDVSKWSTNDHHWYIMFIQPYHFECIFHGAQRSSQRNKHRTYVVVRQIGQVTWCAETHSHCWMVINPCFIGYCLRYYIYIWLCIYCFIEYQPIYIYTYSGLCFCFFLFIWDGWPWPILCPILYCQRSSNTEGVEDPTAKELFGDMGQEPQ